jgi:hypothetical protein
MKSKTNQLNIIYHYSRLLGYRFFKLSLKYFLIADYPYFLETLFLSFLLVLLLGISYPLTITETRVILKTQEKWRNQGVKWRYDIVAKATSDTIWDWKIQEDDLLEKRNKSIFGYETSGWRQFKMVVW